ncbi:MAG TPA: DPP IV N-terminal domain-containing protein [Fulvivirga sp.]|nr:DPP IV N-terminal domain-containing protein [Fulvivirga sp.]
MKSTTLKATILVLLTTAFSINNHNSFGQDKLKSMPGYDQYSEMAPKIRQSVKMGYLSVKWSDDGETFEYDKDGKKIQYNVKTKTSNVIGDASEPQRRGRWNGPDRGRQYPSADSPDGKLKAYTEDRNMWISDIDGANTQSITNDGNETTQIKYGVATWVYGEELRQTTAMWWSPDSKKIAFYRFKEKTVPKYYVLYNQTHIQDSLESEAYPKVGVNNLPVDLMVYDLETKKTVVMDVRNGNPFNDGGMGTYLYGIEWSPDGTELLYHNTNRRQNIMEYSAANPNTGKTRVIVREEWPQSFTENSPEIHFLEDGKRFIWASERSGFKNYYLYNISGKLINAITNHAFEVDGIVKVDEKNNNLYYMARSGENHMKIQLHKVSLKGKNDKRLTDPAFNHSINLSPNEEYFIDIAQTHDVPPFTNLLDNNGKLVAELAKSDMTEFKKLNLKTVEVFTFTSADGETELHGMLHFPSNFDPSKKYPLLLSNYGGPATNAFRETFTFPDALTEYGFLVANIDGRNVKGRGKKMLDQLYGNLGIVEMDDFAKGIKSLYDRPYFDKNNVGVFGTSYGGTTSVTCLLRYPEVFQAACANSAVTDWRNYDNIYTERYMNLIENNKEGYDAGSVMSYVSNLKGDLLIYFGTSDNNVHPANSLQLIQALQKAGKSFEVQVGPDRGHTAVNRDRMMEFFIENLVINKN